MNTTRVFKDLTHRLGEEKVHSCGPGYEQAVAIWNGAVAHRPAVVVGCATTEDVRQAVLAARTHGMPLSVRGGGHGWAGQSLRDGGLVIDLSPMRAVTVDAPAERVTMAGNATSADVTAASNPLGLTTTTGNCSSVGMAGLTLGGGYGPLSGRLGLAADNLLSAEVVLADGRVVTASPDAEPDLFWALRGGGGNFGVVTSMQMRLHAVRQLLAGFIVFPWSDGPGVLARLDEVLGQAPDELTIQPGVAWGPDGSPMVSLMPVWSGELAEGAQHIERLRTLGSPALVQVEPMPHSAHLALSDPYTVNGRSVVSTTRNVSKITSGVTAALLHAGETVPSPFSAVLAHHLHGAAARVPTQDTAFGLRDEHFMIEIWGVWDAGDETRHRAWVDQVSAELAPHALPGGYPNILSPDAHDQITHAYGPNAARLRNVKAAYDPDRVFEAVPLPLDHSAPDA